VQGAIVAGSVFGLGMAGVVYVRMHRVWPALFALFAGAVFGIGMWVFLRRQSS
jgi:hypothetical protein